MSLIRTPELQEKSKEYKLSNGILTRIDLDTSHYYYFNDDYYPSVTSILDEAAPVGYGLRNFWRNNTKEESDAILETARGIGSRVHDSIEQLLLGAEIDMTLFSEREKKCVVSFVDWFRYYQPRDIQPEQPIASSIYKYAGTLDLVATIDIDGKPTRVIVDFKTSSAIHFNYEMQVGAYKQAYKESYGVDIERCFILRIGTTHKGKSAKEGAMKETGEAWEFKETNPNAFEIFKNVYQTYLGLHDGQIPEPATLVVYPTKLKLFEFKKFKEEGVK